ncbi:unnamed protein product [Effrenium voratum]|nr:unnamed protein product [Effrenium voratum]
MNEKNRQKFLQRRSNGEIRRNQAAGTMGVALVWHRYVDGECRQKSLDIARLKVDPVPKPPVEAPQEPELIIEEC